MSVGPVFERLSSFPSPAPSHLPLFHCCQEQSYILGLRAQLDALRQDADKLQAQLRAAETAKQLQETYVLGIQAELEAQMQDNGLLQTQVRRMETIIKGQASEIETLKNHSPAQASLAPPLKSGSRVIESPSTRAGTANGMDAHPQPPPRPSAPASAGVAGAPGPGPACGAQPVAAVNGGRAPAPAHPTGSRPSEHHGTAAELTLEALLGCMASHQAASEDPPQGSAVISGLDVKELLSGQWDQWDRQGGGAAGRKAEWCEDWILTGMGGAAGGWGQWEPEVGGEGNKPHGHAPGLVGPALLAGAAAAAPLPPAPVGHWGFRAH